MWMALRVGLSSTACGVLPDDPPIADLSERNSDAAPEQMPKPAQGPDRARYQTRHTVYDVVVRGSRSGGLAAAVYAASEGLDVLVLDSRSFGGQAGASSRIENYLGFPTGISGRGTTARAFLQAQKFGAQFAVPVSVTELDCSQPPLHRIVLDGGISVFGR